jgi:hypothetical protein
MNCDPIAAARALTPLWMLAIRDYDALELHPCCAISDSDAVEIVSRTMRSSGRYTAIAAAAASNSWKIFDPLKLKSPGPSLGTPHRKASMTNTKRR